MTPNVIIIAIFLNAQCVFFSACSQNTNKNNRLHPFLLVDWIDFHAPFHMKSDHTPDVARTHVHHYSIMYISLFNVRWAKTVHLQTSSNINVAVVLSIA